MNHSFHYFNNAVSFDRLNNNILDKRSGVLVIRLCNLCNFSGVYKPVLEKTMIKKKSLVNYKKWFGFQNKDTAYNYKIRVDINYKKYVNIYNLDLKYHSVISYSNYLEGILNFKTNLYTK